MYPPYTFRNVRAYRTKFREVIYKYIAFYLLSIALAAADAFAIKSTQRV